MATTKVTITVDGSLSDWTTSDQINFGDGSGYSIFARAQDGMFHFGIGGPIVIGPATTAWFNTDRNTGTGYQIFGNTGGAEFNLNIKSDGSAALYTGADGETLVVDNIQLAYSTDHRSIEFAIPATALGNPNAIDTVYDINNSVFLPANYASQPYTVFNSVAAPTDATQRIGIVYSATTAANYFSATAYADLFMATQSQAMQAGISYDLLTEADLTNVSKLATYDALVFPSFANVQAADVAAITDALLQATRQFGVGLITSGNFMTNDATGLALAGDAYARMKLLFDATRVTGGTGNVTINSSDTSQSVFTTMAPGALIRSYTGVSWDTFQSVSGTGQTIATETVDGQTYAAALATQTTGGRNVLFSTAGVMADSNLLWQAINYVAKDPGISVSLELSRFNGIVVSRTDMDQAQESTNVNPANGSPGIYDKLLPILAQWKQAYNFVGSYYVDIGNNTANGQFTDWAVSAPYYAQLLAMGNELGNHSYTHPADTNLLTPAQIQFEFQQSKLLIEQQMSAYLGTPFTVAGAAVPGMPELLPTSEQIIQYFNYITGGAAFVGSGYPGAFGFLAPNLTNSVYLAPNTSFDFTYVDFQNLGAQGAIDGWAREWNALVANANLPIIVWPWHDYGATQWAVGGGSSRYTLEMYTQFIERAYQAGDEFVTAADLAARIQSFAQSGVTSTVSGNVIAVTVTSAHAGDFALDVAGMGSQVIQNAGNWYAYDSDSLFLPETGGNFTITLGAAADDVTHITALPMRGDLVAVTGNGLNLSFSMVGDGHVLIDLAGTGAPIVSGATIASLVGDQLDLALTGLGRHDVSVVLLARVSTIAFSADTGSSATDFITNTPAQTISGTLSSALQAGDVVKVSLNNGTTWLTATAAAGATTFSLAGVTLTASNTLVARVENSAGAFSQPLTQAYVLDQLAPGAPAALDLLAAADSGVSSADNITNAVNPTFAGTAEAGSTITLFDGTTPIGTAIAAGGSWTITAPALTNGTHSITAKATDVAGNVSLASAALAVSIDTIAPAVPSVPDLLAASDSDVSDTDNLTNITRPTFTGTAEAGSTVTLYDGLNAVGTGVATPTGEWSITTTSPLGNGIHSITARATDLAGNIGAASAALSVTIFGAAPSVTAVTASPADAILGLGVTVTLTMTLTEAVEVRGGTPTLTLNNGGVATYASGSGSGVLTFSYAVAADQDVPDLTVTGVNPNGAVVTNQAGIGLDWSGAATNPVGTLQIAPSAIAAFNMTTHQPVGVVAHSYAGPVANLQNEYINITSDNLNAAAATPNWFIHSGSGDDAIAVSSGTNVLDGGTGSNFLVGGSGFDTFFVDDRAPLADIWSTVAGFGPGDAATIWGVSPQSFDFAWVDAQGAAGFTGLTLHATAAGKPTASLTLAGYSQADLSNNRLSVLFGTDPASGSAYMYVHAAS